MQYFESQGPHFSSIARLYQGAGKSFQARPPEFFAIHPKPVFEAGLYIRIVYDPEANQQLPERFGILTART